MRLVYFYLRLISFIATCTLNIIPRTADCIGLLEDYNAQRRCVCGLCASLSFSILCIN